MIDNQSIYIQYFVCNNDYPVNLYTMLYMQLMMDIHSIYIQWWIFTYFIYHDGYPCTILISNYEINSNPPSHHRSWDIIFGQSNNRMLCVTVYSIFKLWSSCWALRISNHKVLPNGAIIMCFITWLKYYVHTSVGPVIQTDNH